MNYGSTTRQLSSIRAAMQIVNRVISYKHKWNRGVVQTGNTRSNRSSKTAWLGDRELLAMLLRMVKKVNITHVGT